MNNKATYTEFVFKIDEWRNQYQRFDAYLHNSCQQPVDYIIISSDSPWKRNKSVRFTRQAIENVLKQGKAYKLLESLSQKLDITQTATIYNDEEVAKMIYETPFEEEWND